MAAEAECAETTQKKRRLTGLLEADATSLRKMRLGTTTTLRYFQAFGVVKREERVVHLCDLGRNEQKRLFFFETFLIFDPARGM